MRTRPHEGLQAKVGKSLGIVASLMLASKVLGFVREQAIAWIFGTTEVTDAYFVSLSVPNIILLALGTAIATAVTPTFVTLAAEQRSAYSARIMNVTDGLGIGLAIVLWIGGRGIVEMVAPGLSDSGRAAAVMGLNILAPGVLFLVSANVMRSFLNGVGEVTWSSLAPLANSVVIIVGAWMLKGYGIVGLAGSALMGMAAQWLVQWRGMRVHRLTRGAEPVHPVDWLQIVRLAWPVLLSFGISQLVGVVDRFLASGLTAGTISALAYADRLRQLPLSVVTASVVSVFFPRFALRVTEGSVEKTKDFLVDSLRLGTAVTVPVSLLLATLAHPVVFVLFEHGQFDSVSTAATAAALRLYALSVVGIAGMSVANYAFYALNDMVTPLYITAAGVALNVILDLALSPSLGHSGLALASTIANLCTWWIYLVCLNRRLPGIFRRSAVWTGAIAVGGLGQAVITVSLSPWIVGHGFLFQFLRICGLSLIGLLVYIGFLIVLRVPEGSRILTLGKRWFDRIRVS